MHKAFSQPPATLHDTFLAAIEKYGLNLAAMSAQEAKLLRGVVSFSYVCAVGRMTAAVPSTEKLSCNENKAALQVLHESLQVLQEVASFNEGEQPQERRLDA